MNNIKIKTFMLQKDGSPSSCKDALNINEKLSRFAVADGVSRSYYPDITAKELCRIFVDEEYQSEEWENSVNEKFLEKISAHWNKSVKLIEDDLDEIDLYDAQLKRELIPAGSSTLAGIELDAEEQSIKYHILGDSPLFIVAKNEMMTSYCSSPRELRDEYSYILFDNNPACVTSERHSCLNDIRMKVIGKWEHGTIPLQEGYLLLMTDGIGKWFQDDYLKNGEKTCDFLWNIQDQQQFEEFVQTCRRDNYIDDDVAVIIMQIPQVWNGQYSFEYRGDLEFRGVKVPEIPETERVTKSILKSLHNIFMGRSWQ